MPSRRRRRGRSPSADLKMVRAIRGVTPLFRLVGALCIVALSRVKSLLRHRSDRPKLTDRSFDLEIHRTCFAAVLFDLGHWGYRRLFEAFELFGRCVTPRAIVAPFHGYVV